MGISQAEWEVMRVFWTLGEASSSQVITVLNQKNNWSPSTVKTLIARLVEKGCLGSQRHGKKFLYRSLIEEDRALEEEVSDLFARICVRKHKTLLAELIQKTPMTRADIASLERLLSSKKDKAVASVSCDCILGQCTCSHHLEVSS
ncbi:CopY/TcrY family copper transport repressor [Streptococcus ferus]|uniref:CopY/TcrY family copper transport repressor n=1 Tax=Streptococcus ferus TaxID=1345 RepID=UPI0035A033B5